MARARKNQTKVCTVTGVETSINNFYAKGQDKVQRAVESYRLFYKNKNFDPKQYFINKTL